jgi:plastocyanin
MVKLDLLDLLDSKRLAPLVFACGVASLTLAGCGSTSSNGGALPDGSVGADLRVPIDLRPPLDLSPGPDLQLPPDLVVPPDLLPAPDLAKGPTTFVVMVGAGGLKFDPKDVQIAVGDTVQWLWANGGHNVVSGMNGQADNKFCSPNDMNCGAAPVSIAGTKYSHKFTQAGAFPYYCKPHLGAGMVGSVTVK